MKNFLNLNDKCALTPPDIIKGDLESRFHNPINIEWSRKGEYYEALFYCESIEHLALYASDGRLVNYRLNLSPSSLPLLLKQSLDPDLEIMNIVKKVVGEAVAGYELITRDSSQQRYLVNMGADGVIIETVIL